MSSTSEKKSPTEPPAEQQQEQQPHQPQVTMFTPPAQSLPQEASQPLPHPLPQPGSPSTLSTSLGAQQETRSDANSRSPYLRLQDLSSTLMPANSADLRCSFSHSHMARPLEIMESIKGLHELHQQGGLTQEEFTQAKQQILDSGSSVTSVPSSKSRRSRTRKHHRRTRRSSDSSDSSKSKNTHGGKTHTTGGHSRAKTKSTRHRSGRSSHSKRASTDSSSTSSSSSSDSSSDQFIVVPRANVWRSLNARLEDGSVDHDSAVLHLTTSPNGYASVQSPLLAGGDRATAFHLTGNEDGGYAQTRVNGSRADGYQPIPGDDPLSRAVGASALDGAVSVPSPNAAEALSATPNSGMLPAGSGAAAAAAALSAAAAAGGGAAAKRPDSQTGSDNREKAKYGTFLNRDEGIRVGGTANIRAELNREDVVRIKYFNSRGRAGNHFNDVELHTSELREPIFLHKGSSQVVAEKARSSASVSRRGKEEATLMALPTQDSQVFHLMEMTPDERKAWEEMSSSPSRTLSSVSSKSSYLEQSLNWYWIDVTGRDPSRKRYNATLRFLTNKFKLCESFLVDRDHMLVLPQVCESPNYPGQYLLNLRVATDKIAISDDSVMELTNRWIIVVDLRQHVVITLHRVDTHSMANLRMLWRRVIENSDVSFQEFLLKIIDDAIRTYQTSIDVHADILDKCEAKLFVDQSVAPVPAMSGHYVDMRILHHFAGSSRSLFLRRLLDDQDRSPMNKGEMNSFLHHLHRRTSVQHRMLNLTQTVLVKAFTKLRLCSREMADQMCASCIEVSDRALEVRDDAKTLLDLHISLQSFRTNELMAVLTRVSLLFTPVTFLAGVYGMNFQKNFPELTWEYGYPCFWVMCVILVIVMQVFFLREK